MLNSKWPRTVWIGLSIAAFLAIAPYAAIKIKNAHERGWHLYRDPAAPGPAEARLRTQFLSDAPAPERFDALFQYFARGYLRHATPSLERIQYSGTGSMDGYRMNGLEGFARTAPLLAAWVYSGRSPAIAASDNANVNLLEILKQGILVGTDPRHADYWGRIGRKDQRIVEAADIARILWLTRSNLWPTLTAAQRAQIVTWLQGASHAPTPNNNWILFPIVVDVVLARLEGDSPASEQLLAYAHQQFDRYKDFYLESGWFFDAPDGVDFYNAWGISYELFWIHSIDPSFDPVFIANALRQSADLTAHLVSPQGIPIMGRSSCYRTAVPAPIVAASLIDDADAETAGRAARALDVVWRYFIAHDSVRDGALTQGYFDDDWRFLDRYSGAGSCQWGVRSLVLAFMHEPGSRFWTGPSAPLPVEIADYEREYPKLDWTIEGHRATGEIVIQIARNPQRQQPIKPYTWINRAVETTLGRPFRPSNHDVKYARRRYSSAQPFMLDE